MENEPVLQGQLAARLELARADKHALNTLPHDYMPFIKKCVSGVFIGVSFVKSNTDEPPAAAETTDDGSYDWQRGQEKMREVERKISEQ
jgi:hypothetical protein